MTPNTRASGIRRRRGAPTREPRHARPRDDAISTFCGPPGRLPSMLAADVHVVDPAFDRRSLSGAWHAAYGRRTMPGPSSPPPTGELLLTGALLSLYVGLRSGAWAVARLERAVPSGSWRRPSPSPGA